MKFASIDSSSASRIRVLVMLLIAVAFFAVSVQPAGVAKIQLPEIFADNMVLQRNKPNAIYGTATPGLKVQVRFADCFVQTRADCSGAWRIELPPMPAGGPYDLVIDACDHAVMRNIVLGDVWLCCGQSNMALDLSICAHTPADVATANYPLVRFFSIAERQSRHPVKDLSGRWTLTDPQRVGQFSACAFYFAREMYNRTKVPVGIICCSARGLPLKSWLSPDIAGHSKNVAGHQTSGVYNGMLSPILGIGLKGLIWYQGEADLFAPEYYRRMAPRMFADLREKWHDAQMPVILVQLPNYAEKDPQPSESLWAEFREVQAEATRSIPNAHLVVTIDSATEPCVGLHPADKRLIAARLAKVALSLPAVNTHVFENPEYDSMEVQHGAILVHLNCHGQKLLDTGHGVKGFTIAGADNRFHWADAYVQPNGTDVLVHSEAVAEPAFVRYAWGDNPLCNLYSSTMQPAVPFRTDKFLASNRGGRTYRRYDFLHG